VAGLGSSIAHIRGSANGSGPSTFVEERESPAVLITKKIWKQRFEDICGLERYLRRNGTAVRKFFLNLSKEEQTKRFLARLERPEKNWKFSMADISEREHWDEYMDAYEDMIRNTATPAASGTSSPPITSGSVSLL